MEKFENVPYKLPDGWKWVRLGDIGKINPKKSEIKDLLEKNIEVSFVPMKFVDDANGEITYSETRLIKDVYKGYTYFRSGDIIFAKITPCMENGKCAIAKDLVNDIGFGSTEFHVIRVSKSINKRLIWFYLRFSKIREEAKKYFTCAVGQKRVPAAFLQNLLIPIPFKNGKPDLEKQKEIVKRIEEIFQRIEKAEELRRRSLEKTKRIFDSALNKIFENAKESGWKWVFLKKIIRSLESGKRPKGGAVNEGIPSIGGEHLNNYGGFNFENVRYIPNDFYYSMKKGKIHKGDILIVKDGATTGKTSFVGDDFPFTEAAVNEHVFIVRLKENYLQKFVFYILHSGYGLNEILRSFGGAAQGGINRKFVDNVRIPIPFKNGKPDLEKQKKIAEYLDKLNDKIKQLEELQKSEMKKFDKLKNSVLNKAFRGELV
jgi:type I restriction enzyme S subunit